MYKIDKEKKKQIIELMLNILGISERSATKLFEALDEVAVKKLIQQLKPSVKQKAFYFSYFRDDKKIFCFVTPLSPKNSLLEEQSIIYNN